MFFQRAFFALLLAVVAFIPACSRWKMGPGCTIHVVNDSGGTVRNLEVAYPGGSFGIASLSTGQVHLRWVQTRKDNGCHFTLKHEDASGKQYATKDLNFENSCPTEISFVVDSRHQVNTGLALK